MLRYTKIQITTECKIQESLGAYCGFYGTPQLGLRCLKNQFSKGTEMNKIIAALIAGFFAVSINAFAADAPKADAAPAAEAATAPAAAEKPATPAPKKAHKKSHKKAAAK
jgi:nucleoid-associated protein YgaU